MSVRLGRGVLKAVPAQQRSLFEPVGSRRPRPVGSLIPAALRLEAEEAVREREIGFTARALVQATLPHSDLKRNEFVRRNGRFTLSILAPVEIGLPYGRYPRLVLAFLCTEAVRRKTPLLELDASFSSFCSRLGVAPVSGPRGTLPALRQQMQRLFASTFQCIYRGDDRGLHAGDGFLVVERRSLWWDPSSDRALGRGSWVELSHRFYREATEAPVPLDLGILQALRSPFEIDIYVWLSWRLYRLERPVTMPWESLLLQFGCGYRSPRHFKHRFLGYLRSVLRYYPEARVRDSPAGLVLMPSRPHVLPARAPRKL